jgi:hypothetical protein
MKRTMPIMILSSLFFSFSLGLVFAQQPQQIQYKDFPCTSLDDCKYSCFDETPLVFSPISCIKYANLKKKAAKDAQEPVQAPDAGTAKDGGIDFTIKNMPAFIANVSAAVNALNKGCFMSSKASSENWFGMFDKQKTTNVALACVDKAETLMLYKSTLNIDIASTDAYKDADIAYWHACHNPANKNDAMGFCSKWAFKFNELSTTAGEMGDNNLSLPLYTYAVNGYRATCVEKHNIWMCPNYKISRKII